jgi:hypothetical protein
MLSKRTFQMIAFSLLGLIIAITLVWASNNAGLYRLLDESLTASGVLEDIESALLRQVLVGFLTFSALALPWVLAMLTLREFTPGMATWRED